MSASAAICDRSDHPDRPHGHYGYGGRYWCVDFNSPLLDEANMGSRKVYAKPPAPTPAAEPVATGLTEAEREALWRAGDHSPEQCDCSPYMPESDDLDQEGCETFYDEVAAVERILTDRVATAKADALREVLSLADTQRIVAHLIGDGTRDGLLLGNLLNTALGASARRRAGRRGCA